MYAIANRQAIARAGPRATLACASLRVFQARDTPMRKHFISPQQLLEDAFRLAWQVFESGFRPDHVVGVWRGGTPVGIAVHELLDVLGVHTDHSAIRTASYTGIGERGNHVQVEGLEPLVDRLRADQGLLLVDDVHDSGLSLAQVIAELQRRCGRHCPQIRIATPYYKPNSNRSGRRPDFYLYETEDWLVFPHELHGLTVEELRAHKPELTAILEQMQPFL
ncbi:phosphoribosyltransferase family protein [Haliea atlantica]